MFRFIHFGDLHLGFPFETCFPPDEAELHRARHFDAFDRMTAAALKTDAAFILFAGDVFDRHTHCTESRTRFLGAMTRFRARGMRVWIAAGNHDPFAEWDDIAGNLPDNVCLFGAQASSEVIRINGNAAAEIAGVSHRDRRELRNLVHIAAEKLRHPELSRIILAHANVSHYQYAAPITPEELSMIPADYCALGHMHQRAVISKKPFALYCGSIYRLAKEENNQYGINLVSMSGHRVGVRLIRF